MKYEASEKQVSYGEPIGILLIDTDVPFIPGDVGNATSYDFPVKYKVVENLTAKMLFEKDCSAQNALLAAGKELEDQGVRAVTADCGYMAMFQKKMADHLEVPVFLSSLLQVPFIEQLLGEAEKIGTVVAFSEVLDEEILHQAGIDSFEPLHIAGLEDKEHFHSAAIEEEGVLAPEKIREELLSVVDNMLEKEEKIGAILLECSMLPPYGRAVQQATGLPVFDYLTMINFVHSAVVKNIYRGHM
ncbi:aspartate/glutamate racemase family protein [Halarsenatibacter silvermanii]|uniref:Aspartate/glutamate racemase family protein n=1 Tax=Halarsenatibacter silvermanii TaxID=321763 RepID=A0A1G9TA27_9FIRM|nr:aspartate/glutamate racemase family protein [Halarsenatibacter silvermanii]SDM44583.1 hypothetical protein SAMN04488692_13610 [Halarsenatibacter silvermanii]